jgi:hypothetical protein
MLAPKLLDDFFFFLFFFFLKKREINTSYKSWDSETGDTVSIRRWVQNDTGNEDGNLLWNI